MTTTTIQVAARTTSKWAGKCKRCHSDIAAGAPIAKVDGMWVCDSCATIPPASAIDPPAAPQPTPTPLPPVTAVPSGVSEQPEPARAGESTEEVHARLWRFACHQSAGIPGTDERERRISALAFYKALMYYEAVHS